MRGLAFSGNLTFIDETHVSSSPEIRPLRVPKYAAFALLTYARKALWSSNDAVSANLAYYFVGDRDDINPTTSMIQNHDAYNRFDLTMDYDAGIRCGLIRDEEVIRTGAEHARPPLRRGVRLSLAAGQFRRRSESGFLEASRAHPSRDISTRKHSSKVARMRVRQASTSASRRSAPSASR